MGMDHEVEESMTLFSKTTPYFFVWETIPMSFCFVFRLKCDGLVTSSWLCNPESEPGIPRHMVPGVGLISMAPSLHGDNGPCATQMILVFDVNDGILQLS